MSGEMNDSGPSMFNQIGDHGIECNDDFGFMPARKAQMAAEALKNRDVEDNPESNDERGGDEYDDIMPEKEQKASSGGRRRGKASRSTIEDDECGGVWGDLNKPFIGFKMASITHAKKKARKDAKATPPEKQLMDIDEPPKAEGEEEAEENEETPKKEESKVAVVQQ